MQSGRIVEDGTHESLLSKAGVYSGLVHAQQLLLGDHDEGSPLEGEDIAAVQQETIAAKAEADSPRNTPKTKGLGFFSSVGRLVYEQRSRWPIYIISITAGIVVAAGTPVQAYLFAEVIIVFDETGDALVNDSRFWALMWLVLGLIVGGSYFVLGFSSTQVEHRVGATYRQEYFESLLGQRIAYFDEEGHAAGTLTSQALGDPKKFQELLGVQGAQVYIGIFNLLGGISKRLSPWLWP